jgi:hypothetical protein
MPDQKTDSQGYGKTSADEERDLASKGGPTTSLGIPDDKHGIAHPYDEDIQTQLAAKSTEKKKETKKEIEDEE